MTNLESVLFDLDGTLIDTAPDFVTVLNKLLVEEGKQPLAFDTIRAIVSDGARALVQLGFGVAEGEAGFDPLRERLLDLYSAHLSVDSQLFPEMEQVLNTLEEKNIPWGIVTNKPRQYAEPLLEDLTLAKRCATLICPDDVTHRKPHAEPILLACKEIEVNPTQSVYVGDHSRDITSGNNAGCITVACRYGYISPRDPIEHWDADHYIDTAGELLQILKQTHNLDPINS